MNKQKSVKKRPNMKGLRIGIKKLNKTDESNNFYQTLIIPS